MKIKIMKTLLSVAVLAAMTSGAFAGGTAPGVVVKNTASIAYKVGTVTQTPIYSSEGGNTLPGVPGTAGAPTVAATVTDFTVDRKIDLTVTPPGSTTNVTPNAPGDLTFQVTNEGNAPQDFSFTISDIAGGDFDVSGCTAAPTSFTALAVDTATDVVVTCAVPNSGSAPNGGTANAGSVANTKTSTVDLLVSVDGVVASTGADDPDAEDIVFADGTGTATDTGGSTGGGAGDRNAKHSAVGTYIVAAPVLTVKKIETVAKMSIDLGTSETATDVTTGNLYHIPGATITYTVTVANAVGAALAKDVVISDLVKPELENVTAVITGGTSSTVTVTGNQVDSAGFDLAAGQTATLTITATVK
ncbi:MAG: hypothetical protein V3U64_00895 [Cocleimonas sp.]